MGSDEVLELIESCIHRGFSIYQPETEQEKMRDLTEFVQYEIFNVLAGGTVYFSKVAIKHLRDKRIKAEFNGKNVQILAQKYHLSMQSIYKILKGE